MILSSYCPYSLVHAFENTAVIRVEPLPFKQRVAGSSPARLTRNASRINPISGYSDPKLAHQTLCLARILSTYCPHEGEMVQ